MNEIMSALLLLSVPGLPLLLAFPALRSYLPRPCYVALLPAIIIVVVPGVVSLEMPWLLFGTILGIDEMSRLLLAMSVVLWAAGTTLLYASGNYSSDDRLTTWFMLTLAANLGAILAIDLVSFFAFLTLTGYGFYALLVSEGGEDTQRSGRVYLSFMIVADLVLFEALLIAAAMTDDLGFTAVHHAIAQSPSPDLYLLMVLIGFAGKAGFWPLHFWLPMVFRSSRPEVAMLLGGVPIAVGLLGMVRWLPLGETTSPELGMIMQILGAAAILYAIISALIQAQLRMLPAYAAIIFTGFYAIAIGTGLAGPAAWNRYENWVYFFIVFFGIGFAILVTAGWWLESKYNCCIMPVQQSDYLNRWFKRHWLSVSIHLINQKRINMLSFWCAKVEPLCYSPSWKKILARGEHFFRHWNIAITLLLLLGIVVVVIGVLS